MSSSQLKKQGLVFCICIAEFDILKGNTLSYTYPPDVDLATIYKDKNLADLCLPDGAHIYEEDQTYIFLPSPTTYSSSSQQHLFGMVQFKNKRDNSVKRGAVQKSIVLFSFKPLFSVWEPLLKSSLQRVMDNKDKPDNVLKTLFNELSDEKLLKNMSVTLFGEKIPIKMPKLEEDQFAGASLISLINRFKQDSLLIWYALLLNKRLFFIGTPAKEVANCCLACPLMVHPLHGFTKLIAPYVALTDLEPVFRPSFINGSTNSLFGTKQEWYDFCANFQTGSVIHHSKDIKIGATDREFFLNVQGGIKDGKSETWVREQFSKYTKKFLDDLLSDSISSSKKKIAQIFKSTPYYATYMEKQSEKPVNEENESAVALLSELQDANIPVLDRVKKIFNLSKLLEDLTTVDEVCENNGVGIVSEWLFDENSQFRKYSAAVIASLSASIKGQLAIVSSNILQDKIAKLFDDEMPNVRSAAFYCVMKISSLYVGVKTLIKSNLVEKLVATVQQTSNGVDIKSYAVEALYNIYLSAPELSIPDVSKFKEECIKTADKKYGNRLILLLDVWKVDLKGIVKPSKLAEKYMAKLQDADSKMESSRALSIEFSNDTALILEMIELGVISTLLDNDIAEMKCTELAEVSMYLLTLLADTNYGFKAIMKTKLVDICSKILKQMRILPYICYILRFIEVLSQHEEGCKELLKQEVVSIITALLSKYYGAPLISNIATSAMRALYAIFRMASISQSVHSLLLETSSSALETLKNLPTSSDSLPSTADLTMHNKIATAVKKQQQQATYAKRLTTFSASLYPISKHQLDKNLAACFELLGKHITIPHDE